MAAEPSACPHNLSSLCASHCADSAWKQQMLKAWRPILTPRLVILLFTAVGVVFIPIGIAIVVTSNQVRL